MENFNSKIEINKLLVLVILTITNISSLFTIIIYNSKQTIDIGDYQNRK